MHAFLDSFGRFSLLSGLYMSTNSYKSYNTATSRTAVSPSCGRGEHFWPRCWVAIDACSRGEVAMQSPAVLVSLCMYVWSSMHAAEAALHCFNAELEPALP